MEKKLIERGDSLLLSMSAGKDSMFMLSMVRALQEEFNLRLGVFHLNHLTRGDESHGDESFLREYLASLGIESFFERHDFSTKNKEGKARLSFEERARKVRYSMLRELQSRHGFYKILTAHNMEDNGETIFMRMLRGTGIRGLEGIPEMENGIVRPILTFGRDEIYGYLRENNIPWREDSSNSSNKYDRNYIRNEIFPTVLARFPHSIQNLVKLASHARESRLLTEELLSLNYKDFVHREGDSFFIITAENDIPLLRFIIAEILRNNYDIVLSNSVYGEIFRKLSGDRTNLLLYSSEKVHLRKGLFRGKGAIIISHGEVEEPCGPWSYTILNDREGEVVLEEVNARISYKKCSREEYLRLKEEGTSRGFYGGVAFALNSSTKIMEVRNIREGDKISIERGSKKIKDLMIEKKLDSVAKKKVPLISIDNEVAVYFPLPWVDDTFRVSKKYWIDDNSEEIILLKYSS